MKKRGKLYKNKRAVATELFLEAMQAIAIIFVLISSFSYAQNELGKIGFQKKFYARDISLLTTAMYSAPGNIYYLYEITYEEEPGRYNFSFETEDNFIRVNATESPQTSTYWFFDDKNLEGFSLSESSSTGILKFAKEPNEMKAGFRTSSNPKQILCPFIDTKKTAWKTGAKLILDPGAGLDETDKGEVNSQDTNFYEEERMLFIALNAGFEFEKGSKRLLTREKDGKRFVSLQERNDFVNENYEENSIIISLHAGNNADISKAYIKAYYNSESDEDTKIKNRKLGCKILNAIINSEGLTGKSRIEGLAVIPSDSEYITKVIPEGKTGVLLEIGNIQIPKNQNMINDPTTLSRAIFRGINEYYEAE